MSPRLFALIFCVDLSGDPRRGCFHARLWEHGWEPFLAGTWDRWAGLGVPNMLISDPMGGWPGPLEYLIGKNRHGEDVRCRPLGCPQGLTALDDRRLRLGFAAAVVPRVRALRGGEGIGYIGGFPAHWPATDAALLDWTVGIRRARLSVGLDAVTSLAPGHPSEKLVAGWPMARRERLYVEAHTEDRPESMRWYGANVAGVISPLKWAEYIATRPGWMTVDRVREKCNAGRGESIVIIDGATPAGQREAVARHWRGLGWSVCCEFDGVPDRSIRRMVQDFAPGDV